MTPQQFRQFADLLSEPALLVDGDGMILDANRVFRSSKLQAPDEVCGRRLQELVVSDNSQIDDYLRACARRHDIVIGAMTFAQSDGEPARFRCLGGALSPRSETEPARILLRIFPREVSNAAFEAVNLQLAERAKQRFSEALRASEQMLRTIFDQAGVGVALIDSCSGRFIRINQRFCDLVDHAPDEMTDITWQQVAHPDDVQADSDNIGRLVAGEIRSYTTVQRYLRRDGSTVWVQLTVSPTWEPGEVPSQHIAVVQDISDRKQAEDQRDQHASELAEKAVQLDEQRHTAVALAEELKKADKAKSEFLANMSHEIRTPMNAVMGLTELVLQSKLDDIQRDYLSTVMDSAESLLTVINDILDFSKIEAGMLRFEQVNFNLHDLVGDTVRAQALRAERKGLELACFVDSTIPDALLGDPGRLRQVLTNLLGNAIKFTETGEVVVRVEPASEKNGQLLLNFSVSDTGVGIESGKLESIFEPFEQADMSTTRQFGGTGLGLAICHRLVSLMRGRIEIDSETGHGSTFRFTAGFAVSETASRPAPVPSAIKGMRVLIVDDNATNRTILEQILLAKEMAPVTAPSAIDGFALLKDAVRDGRPFRLLVSDVHMPQIDGFGLAEMIRADDCLSELEIVHLTSTGTHGDQKRCQDLRIAGQLTKPVKQSELYNVMMRVLGLDSPGEGGWLDMHDKTAERELPPLRILLVEDGLANQKVALAVLSGAGHTTVVANDGKEALAILGNQKFDVILMDIQMPVMDGLEATAAIRASEHGTGKHQPIVAMTAHAMADDRNRCLDAGMDEYVSKPVGRELLFQAIAVAIGFEPYVDPSMSGVLKSRASTERLVDWTGPLGQLRGDHAVLKDITESYMVETRENLCGLTEAIAVGNAQESQRLAHTVKGAMRFFRAASAQQAGQELEDLATTGDLRSAPDLFDRFKSEVECVLPVLQRFIDTGEM